MIRIKTICFGGHSILREKKISASFQFWTNAYTDHRWRAWYNGSYTIIAKPIKTLELHYEMSQFLIISLNIWANIAVTKHVLLADIPYRPRLLGFHSLHVNAMKCIYVGFSLSKLQTFFWKRSLNSRLIRLEGFNIKISPNFPVCSMWPSASKVARSIPGITFCTSLLFFSFLFFSSFFFFSVSFHFSYNSFVMFLYIAYHF